MRTSARTLRGRQDADISSAMLPVVQASSTKVGRAALGVYCGTFSEIATSRFPADADAIETGGYAAAGDGGAARYYRFGTSDPGASYPDAAKKQSLDGAWWLLDHVGRPINPRQLGAKGDRTTNDDTAIAAAKLLAQTSGMYRIHFPEGEYLMPAGLTVTETNWEITFDGRDSVTLLQNTDAPHITVDARNTPFMNITIGSCEFENSAATISHAAKAIWFRQDPDGYTYKAGVRVATTTAGTLATSFENGDTVDGVALVTGDRILIKDQAAAAENGVYVVASSGAPTRAFDADAGAEFVGAAFVVAEGTANAGKTFACQNGSAPTLGSTAITFAQGGLTWKTAARVATTTAGTLASSFENGDTVDGVVLATNDRILIKDQATASENGLYVVQSSGAPTRATDMNAGDEFPTAAICVTAGTVNAGKIFTCTNSSAPTLGSTSITFAQYDATYKAVWNSWVYQPRFRNCRYGVYYDDAPKQAYLGTPVGSSAFSSILEADVPHPTPTGGSGTIASPYTYASTHRYPQSVIKFAGANGVSNRIIGGQFRATDAHVSIGDGVAAVGDLTISGVQGVLGDFGVDIKGPIDSTYYNQNVVIVGSQFDVVNTATVRMSNMQNFNIEVMAGPNDKPITLTNCKSYIAEDRGVISYANAAGTVKTQISNAGVSSLTDPTIIDPVFGAAAASDIYLRIISNAGQFRWLLFHSGAVATATQRWFVGVNNGAEGGANAGSDFVFRARDDAGSFITDALTFTRSNGYLDAPGVYAETTASAANVFVATDGSLRRSTSAAKYKRDIEPINMALAKRFLEIGEGAAIWYRSLSEADPSNWGFYGFRADDFAQEFPQLVHWKTHERVLVGQEPDVTFTIGEDADGNPITETRPGDPIFEAQALETPEVEGMAYERTTAMLTKLVADLMRRVEALEAAAS